MLRSVSLVEQIAAVEAYLRRELPSPLRDLYLTGQARALGLLPLTTGREHEGPSNPPSLADALEKFSSVLGWAMGNSEHPKFCDDYVWPERLLLVEDVGCAVYRAVDLDDPGLRVVEYENFEPAEDPDAESGDARLAFREPIVPRQLQHRFTVVADSLEAWLLAKAHHN